MGRDQLIKQTEPKHILSAQVQDAAVTVESGKRAQNNCHQNAPALDKNADISRNYLPFATSYNAVAGGGISSAPFNSASRKYSQRSVFKNPFSQVPHFSSYYGRRSSKAIPFYQQVRKNHENQTTRCKMEKLREMIRTRQEARKMRKQNIKMKEEKSPEVEMTTPPLSSLGKRLRNNSSLKMLSAKPAKQSKISISSTPQTARVQKISRVIEEELTDDKVAEQNNKGSGERHESQETLTTA